MHLFNLTVIFLVIFCQPGLIDSHQGEQDLPPNDVKMQGRKEMKEYTNQLRKEFSQMFKEEMNKVKIQLRNELFKMMQEHVELNKNTGSKNLSKKAPAIPIKRKQQEKPMVENNHGALRRLEEADLDLDVTLRFPTLDCVRRIAALPNGEAFIYNSQVRNNTGMLIKLNKDGTPVHTIYTCTLCKVTGLFILGENVCLVHINGTVLQFNVKDGSYVNIYHISDSNWVLNQGSLAYEPAHIPDNDLLLLADNTAGTVFTYRLSTGEKWVRITGLQHPVSVSYNFCGNKTFYIVCETAPGNKIKVFDHRWRFIRVIGEDELDSPHTAITTPEGTVLVADKYNYRVAEYDIRGKFLGNVLQKSDGLYIPQSLAISPPYFWVKSTSLRRYRIYNLTYSYSPE